MMLLYPKIIIRDTLTSSVRVCTRRINSHTTAVGTTRTMLPNIRQSSHRSRTCTSSSLGWFNKQRRRLIHPTTNNNNIAVSQPTYGYSQILGKRSDTVSFGRTSDTMHTAITTKFQTTRKESFSSLQRLHGRHYQQQLRFGSSSSESKTAITKGTESGSSGGANNATSTSTTSINSNSWRDRFWSPKPMPERYTAAWYKEMILVCTVFAITGSSTMVLVRPAVKTGLGIRGTWTDGPWSFRICSIVIMTPIYATLLVIVGTIFGRHYYFKQFAMKLFHRFGIPYEVMDPKYNKNIPFRKW